ncbi:MAG: hypothetical protein RL226_2405 [Bacteroidota bacterium]|jgi:guanylate kinase
MFSNEVTGKCVIFSAPSGAGKTTIVRHLLGEQLNLAFSVSATSRSPRSNEKQGESYYFMTPHEFRERISKGEFLEWEEVYEGQYYGTLKSEIDRIWSEGKNVIFDVDVIGGKNLKAFFGNRALAIFISAPSVEELERRLRLRGTESEETLKRRVSKAAYEMTYHTYFDAVVVNDDLETAKKETLSLVKEFLKP